MSDLDLIIDLHLASERQGPGSAEATLRALDMIPISSQKELQVADIGCGSGGQTITLAQHLDGKILAVDLFAPFLDQLRTKAESLELKASIETIESSMDNMPFGAEQFDIIWSEGAVYIMGFEAGIQMWKDYLKPGGYLAISEITWITPSRPQELEDFWNEAYPEIDLASEKISILEDNGYTLSGYFYLPQECWTDQYYRPLQQEFTAFLDRHNHSEAAKNVVQEYVDEISLYEMYKDFFSYGFYIARKA